MAVTGIFLATIAFSTAALAESAGQYIDDATVTARVKAALLQDKNLKATQVSVKTDQGSVLLSGSVTSTDQEAEAVRVANQIDGVKIVKDQIQVSSSQQQ